MNYINYIPAPTVHVNCQEVHQPPQTNWIRRNSSLHSCVHQTSSEVTDLAARELVALLHGVRSPPPLLVPGLGPLLCPLLSLWERRGEVKASGVWLSGSVLTNPERGRRKRKTCRDNTSRSAQMVLYKVWCERNCACISVSRWWITFDQEYSVTAFRNRLLWIKVRWRTNLARADTTLQSRVLWYLVTDRCVCEK